MDIVTYAMAKKYTDKVGSTVLRYKGTVADYQHLPQTDNGVGDVWNVEDSGSNYAWTGTAWDKLSETVDLSGKENSSNKVTSLSANSTDTQYPSAKCVYDMIGDIETVLTALTTGGGVA